MNIYKITVYDVLSASSKVVMVTAESVSAAEQKIRKLESHGTKYDIMKVENLGNVI